MRGATVCAAAIVMLAQSPAPLPAALEKMVATERAFAAMGAEKGPRDSFLVYFADEAVSLDGSVPRRAKDAIREWPAPKPGARLLWEPRTGDIASSEDLGYLTGPVTRVGPDGTRGYACYMSVWKRQADGNFKVVMDFGTTSPQAVPFEPGFVRSWNVARFHGEAAAARSSLEDTERALAADGEKQGAIALAARLADQSRLYRDAMMPIVGKAASTAWLRAAGACSWSVQQVEVSAAGDLGYAWGGWKAEAAGQGQQHGYYVRVWGRGADGAWRVLVDVVQLVG